MNNYLLTAGILCFVMGVFHSIIGEKNIFNSKRNKGNLVPTKASPVLIERHLRVIWVVWHFVSIFICGIGALLVKMALPQQSSNAGLGHYSIQVIMYTLLGSAILALVGTKGKHPVWIVLLIVAVLLMIGI